MSLAYINNYSCNVYRTGPSVALSLSLSCQSPMQKCGSSIFETVVLFYSSTRICINNLKNLFVRLFGGFSSTSKDVIIAGKGGCKFWYPRTLSNLVPLPKDRQQVSLESRCDTPKKPPRRLQSN